MDALIKFMRSQKRKQQNDNIERNGRESVLWLRGRS